MRIRPGILRGEQPEANLSQEQDPNVKSRIVAAARETVRKQDGKDKDKDYSEVVEHDKHSFDKSVVFTKSLPPDDE